MKKRMTISAIFLAASLALTGGTGAYASDSSTTSSGEQEATLQVDGYDGFILTINKGEIQKKNGQLSVKSGNETETLPKQMDAGKAGTVTLSYEKIGDNKLRIKPSSDNISAQAGSKGTTTNWDKSFDKCVSEAALEAAGAGAVGGAFAVGPIGAIIAAAGGALGNGVMAWFLHCDGKPAMKH